MTDKTQLLDQLLEDLAGEEMSEFVDHVDLDNEYSKFSEVDEFADIDNFH
ncbi:MAG: hypothetical protein KFB94_09510 [Methylophilaceae bacterium]|jgi:hypothetical protein|nr:MAG: hypothetical protein KFB94_09510 [Methylophilaceae bacterium]